MPNFTDKDLYEVLHINKNATLEEIRIAYRRLARIHHPDINESKESEEIFKQIRQAYEILSNEEKKNLYDLKNNFNQPEEKEDEPSCNNENVQTEEQKADAKTNNSKTLAQLFIDIIEGIFIFANKQTSNKTDKTKKGEDLFADVTISAKEALLGTSRIINVMQSTICPNCNGKKFINESLCPLCKGTGEISNHRKINATIPPNTKNNDKIKIAGSGNQGTTDGQNGDLYLIITIDEKSLFTVKDNVVYMELPITPFEAALGASIKIPTFYEDIIIKIPPNTSSGQKFRLKEQGIYFKENKTNGDMIVTVQIKLPKELSKQEQELYNELKNNCSYDIREGLKNDN